MEDEAKVRGEIWGTPYYVAPEKLDHKPEDFRSDIYSLGGTLFQLAATVFLIISMVRAWRGEVHRIAPLKDAVHWFNQHIDPRKES